MYKLIPSKAFIKSLSKMEQGDKKKIQKALNFLKDNPRHPSLRTKNIQATGDFESSASEELRIIWTWLDGKIYLIDGGNHKLVEY